MTAGNKNEVFARDLGLDSQYLPELNRGFGVAFRERKIPILTIYETDDSPSLVVRMSMDKDIVFCPRANIVQRKLVTVGPEQARRSGWYQKNPPVIWGCLPPPSLHLERTIQILRNSRTETTAFTRSYFDS